MICRRIAGIAHHLVASLRVTFEARASEWALGWILFLWGLVLIRTDDLFDRSPVLGSLGRFADQDTWGVLAMTLGAARLIILSINGALRRSPHLRALSAFVSSFFWMQISFGFVLSGAGTTGLAVYPVLLVLDSYNVLRAIGEAGIVDGQIKRASQHGTDT